MQEHYRGKPLSTNGDSILFNSRLLNRLFESAKILLDLKKRFRVIEMSDLIQAVCQFVTHVSDWLESGCILPGVGIQAEIMAIHEDIFSELLQRQVRDKRILICSASESSIKTLSPYRISSKIVLQYHEVLESLPANNDLGAILTYIVMQKLTNQLKSVVTPERVIGNYVGLTKSLLRNKPTEITKKSWTSSNLSGKGIIWGDAMDKPVNTFLA